jgi:hypothetical protein
VLTAEIFAALSDSGVDLEYPDDPSTFREAMDSPYAKEWQAAMAEEFASIKQMGVYNLVPRSTIPFGQKVMRGRPVFHIKCDENGKIARFKCRYVCCGYSAVYGQDYNKTTSPTMRMESFRTLLHIAASRDWDTRQFDVKTAFLYGRLDPDEVCYMEQPEGHTELGKEGYVWQLVRGLYGMKQGGHVWNRTLHLAMIGWGFKRLDCEYCVYYWCADSGTVITGIHVDDFLSVASTHAENERFMAQLRGQWKISDLGDPKFCIGIAVERNRNNHSVALSQMALIDRIISQFRLTNAFPCSTPMDAGWVIPMLVMLAAWILAAQHQVTVFSLGYGIISWSSRKQKTVSTSTCEAEYVVACDSCKEVVWLRALLNAIDIACAEPTQLLCDNNAAIILSGDPSFHNRVKHIDTKYHYIREHVEAKTLTVAYVNTKDNIADAFTKPLDPKPFTRMRELMGLKD